MKLFPAIDFLGGRAVRLERGERAKATVFHEHTVELVSELAIADRLHVVDLDGAFGEPRQAALLRSIVAASAVPVEVGGGIRDRATVEEMLEIGVSFVVLGTAAVKDPALVEQLCTAHPARVIVAVDARDGIVSIDGWTKSGNITAIALGQRAAGWGAAALLYTDIARDGVHTGPNIEATAELSRAAGCEVIASGGVSSLDDLARLRDAGIPAAVVGRALYDKRFTVLEALRVARGVA
ncbi:MAG: 1-(5-phosphoribosyl)-5-[(5-phosphoribosylamino)methylideneamino] imidazole-4-carboxamide isomerase [Deltaproteobacteria bacterium]|nr:1-(5-phosphoribosyl)-5-[(5-phosphoribosylamino)methylideneamino] imidazole-4-carboxamide isomerase [Deltaproteobacteria bacterium]